MNSTWDEKKLRWLYYEQHLTLREIADRYNVSYQRIQQVMNDLGIKKRRQGMIAGRAPENGRIR